MEESAIELSDIVNFVGEFVRPKQLGRELAESLHHFVFFGRAVDHERVAEIKFVGACLTSKLKEKPHDVEVIRKYTEDGSIALSSKCTCKAGSNRCKHIVGLMLKLAK